MTEVRCLTILWLLASLTAATAEETVLVSPPDGPWQAETWPLVIALGEDAEAVARLQRVFAPTVGHHGALLAALVPEDREQIIAAMREIAEHDPIRADQVIVIAERGKADWALAEMLANPTGVDGLILIDPAAAQSPAEVAALPPVVLLITDDERMEPNQLLAARLRQAGLSCALEPITVDELTTFVGAALTELLPDTPPCVTLHDPVTGADLKAVPGWEFVRDDFFFAIARPADVADGPRIEVATGLLGDRSFEGYVEQTQEALRAKDIELKESTRVTPPDAPSLAHAFYFIDRREKEAKQVYWVLVGHGNRMVSFRSVAPHGELTDYYDQIRNLALSVTFAEPEGE